jgi:hypothetical protein
MSDVLHSRAPLSFIPLAPFLSRVEFLGEMSDVLHSRAPLPLIPLAPFLSRVEFLGEMSDVLHSRAPLSLIPLAPFLSRVEFLGEMSDVLHSRAPLPLIPPAPFSHEGRRGSLGVLMPETGDGTQGLPEKPTLSRMPLSPGSSAPLCAARGEQRRIPMPVVPPDQRGQRARR